MSRLLSKSSEGAMRKENKITSVLISQFSLVPVIVCGPDVYLVRPIWLALRWPIWNTF